MRRLIAPLVCLALVTPAAADTIRDATLADTPTLLALYQDLHRHPELSFQEVRTAARLADEMRGLGFEVTTGVGRTGVVAVLKNGRGPTVMIRTDMDALPVAEETGLPYASTATGTTPEGLATSVMHACGHDMHMTSWVGTARRLVSMQDRWSGTLVMIAQPAEERGGGARAMLADGLYTRFPKPDYALALHGHPGLPPGTIAYSSGYAMANVDSVDLTIRGVGGHGAYPHAAKDPIVLAARTIVALQTLVSRENDPQSPAVVTVGSIHGGTKHNIIPDEVKLQITMRSYDDDTRERLLAGIRRVAEGEAAAAGMPKDRMPLMTVGDDFTPATFNTERLTRRLAAVFAERFGKGRVLQQPPVMGGEDFGEFHRADRSVESLIFWLGAADRDRSAKRGPTKLASLHSSTFAPDVAPAVAMGVEAMTAATLELLGKH